MLTVYVKPWPIILQLKEQASSAFVVLHTNWNTQVLTHNTESAINNETCIFWALKWCSSLTKTAFLVILTLSTCLSICFTPFLIITQLGHSVYRALWSYQNVTIHGKKKCTVMSKHVLTLWFQNRDFDILFYTGLKNTTNTTKTKKKGEGGRGGWISP
jgi:hypothetical protein